MIAKLTNEQVEFYKNQLVQDGEFRKPEHRRLRIAVTKSLLNDAMHIEDDKEARVEFSRLFLSDSTLYVLAMADLLVEYEGEMFDKALDLVAKEFNYEKVLSVGLAINKLSPEKLEKVKTIDTKHEISITVDGLIRGYLAWKEAGQSFDFFKKLANDYWAEILANIKERDWFQGDVRNTILNVYHENPLCAEGIVEIIKSSASNVSASSVGFYINLLDVLGKAGVAKLSGMEQYQKNKEAFREATFDICTNLKVIKYIDNIYWQLEALSRLDIDKGEMIDFFEEHILENSLFPDLTDQDNILRHYGAAIGNFFGKIVMPENLFQLVSFAERIFNADNESNWQYGDKMLLPLAKAAVEYGIDESNSENACSVFKILYYAGYINWADDELEIMKQLARMFGALAEPAELLEFEMPIEADNYSNIDNIFTEMIEASFANHAVEDNNVMEVIKLAIKASSSAQSEFFERNDNLKVAYAKYNEIINQNLERSVKIREFYKVLEV